MTAAATKRAPVKRAPKKVAEKPVEAEVAEDAAVATAVPASFEELSEDMQLILAEAERIEAEVSAERDLVAGKILANVVAYWRMAQKGGYGLNGIMNLQDEISQLEDQEGLNELQTMRMAGDLGYQIMESLFGKEKAAGYLEELNGEKIPFLMIWQEAQGLAEVKKA